MRIDEAIVLDKNANVAFKNVVEDNRPAPYVSSKPFDPSDISLLGQNLPDLQLQDALGKSVSLVSLINSNDKPKLLFFYRIPQTHLFRDISEPMKEVTSPLQMISAITEQSAGEEYLALLKRFEMDLYCR